MDLSIKLETEQQFLNGLLHLRDVCLTEWKYLFPTKVNIDKTHIEQIRKRAFVTLKQNEQQFMTDDYCGFIVVLHAITDLLIKQNNDNQIVSRFTFNDIKTEFGLPNDFMDHMIAYAIAHGIEQNLISLNCSANHIKPVIVNNTIH